MTKIIWDKIYENFDRFSQNDFPFYSRLVDLLSPEYHDSDSILEVGSGSGYMVSFFQQKGLFSVGIDRNIEPAKVAKRHFQVRNMIQADMFNLPFRDNTFDIVWNEGVLEHFPDPRNLIALKEMTRVSRGKVIVAVPNTTPFWVIRKYLLKIIRRWPYGYEESYSVRRLKNLVRSSDLKLERIYGVRILPPIKEIKKITDIFSIVVLKGDEVEFTHVSYLGKKVKIPRDLVGNQYGIVQLMVADTVYLPATVLKPRPTPEQFARDFANVPIPDDQYEIARKNTNATTRRILLQTIPGDGGEATRMQMNKIANRAVYQGQAPPINILNPEIGRAHV